jgi:hypothetical protein
MKTLSRLVLLALLVFSPRVAMAKDYCINFGGTDLIFKAFALPAKSACKPIIEVVPSIPGLVSSGAGCTTTDGKTLIFTLSDGMGGIETIAGSITYAGGTGTADDCFAADSTATSCVTASISVEACAKKPPAITDVSPGNLISRGPLLAR